ncbi:undecaprenyl-diphosphate phosphatase [Clostridium sediminicola]|uniref:undecaprenyl-diphosphate phosphatase n=1 Tax=Clostridium sediminicola TaxID=3114879 RepID=UPI003D16E04D
MLFIIKAVIIGIVEGFTEFIPVSSTGHMIIIGHLIGFVGNSDPTSLYSKEFTDMFEVVIQLGAILAIVVLYWGKIMDTLKNFSPKHKNSGLIFWLKIIVASLPAAVIGLKFDDLIKAKLFHALPVTLALLIGAIWMIYAENKFRGKSVTKLIDDISFKQALIIGCFQCLAMWPGMSRSASTIIGGWIVGLSTVAAAEFSFFLALPVMVGASLLSFIKMQITLNTIQIIALTAGFIVSFIVALVVVDKFIGYLKKKEMKVFAYYRIIVAVLLFVLFFTKVISI